MPPTDGRPGAPGPAATGVVLAGGGSTRFSGGDKALATVGDEPTLARVVTALRAATGRPPVVAAGPDDRRASYEAVLPGSVAFVRDEPDRSGPLAGLAGAAAAVRTPWLFVAGGDMPLLSPAAVRWVLARAGSADAAVPVSADGTLQPLHAAYRRSAVRDALGTLPESAGPRSLVDALGSRRELDVADAPSAVPLAESLSDVDTRADLEAVRSRVEGRPGQADRTG